MLIAHLPAGYLAAQLYKDKYCRVAVMAGSLLPDLDLLYFYTLGQRAVVHHHYWMHKPFFWLSIFAAALPILYGLNRKLAAIGVALFVGILIHLSLDSVTGSIFWLWPFNESPLTLVHVPAVYASWQMNFILHWTFLAEILIILAAAIVFVKNRIKLIKILSRNEEES